LDAKFVSLRACVDKGCSTMVRDAAVGKPIDTVGTRINTRVLCSAQTTAGLVARMG
jgi:hypothetical protein